MAASRFVSEDSKLIADLHALSKKSPKLVKSSTYPAPADSSITVRSWKMNEFKYYDVPSPFPTLARGIFSIELPKENAVGSDETTSSSKYRIVVRGYDKFFNIGEVPWCTWNALDSHTSPPYTLTLKSNGCIIFIAALTPSKLLITSKHSLGPVQGSEVSHAQAGEAWVRKYLDAGGRKEEDLAKRLWDDNLTAVAELCDDSFEEHVLPYPPSKTGLHLHGLNISTCANQSFTTLPQPTVDAFAREWGFIHTPSVTLKTIAEVRAFTARCAEEGGSWEGEPVEGFVVRTTVTDPLIPGTGGIANASKGKSPYPPGSSFFFKVKFDEPYMMYRDWRELTKKLLSSSSASIAGLPKSKLARAETRVYVRWVVDEIKRDKKQFEGYTKGKGIIATRERFLEFLETEEGKKELKVEKGRAGGEKGKDEKVWKKTIIAPVAIPGCGKTAVSVALAHIFGFGHTQSDDVMVKKAAPQFIKNVKSLLGKHDVVIADKNNHLVQHRQALRDLAKSQSVPTRLVVLNWSVDAVPQATVHRICGDRITRRGENHQTLRPDVYSPSSASTGSTSGHEDVIWMFLKTREEITEGEADAVVEMPMEEGIEEAVRRAVDEVVGILELERPSEEKIKEALKVVGEYKPSMKKPDEGSKNKKTKKEPVRYYGLLAEMDLESVLGAEMDDVANNPDQEREEEEGEAVRMWEKMKRGGRVAKRPHVTFVHRTSLPGEQALWDQCMVLQIPIDQRPLFRVRLGHLVWNPDVMALVVEDIEVVESERGGGGGESVKKGQEFLQGLSKELKQRLHVTVATANEKIAPVLAKSLVEDWWEGKTQDSSGKIRSIPLQRVSATGRINALVY